MDSNTPTTMSMAACASTLVLGHVDGMKWGTELTYETYRQKQPRESYLGTRFGNDACTGIYDQPILCFQHT